MRVEMLAVAERVGIWLKTCEREGKKGVDCVSMEKKGKCARPGEM